jgi:hypothetical protein
MASLLALSGKRVAELWELNDYSRALAQTSIRLEEGAIQMNWGEVVIPEEFRSVVVDGLEFKPISGLAVDNSRLKIDMDTFFQGKPQRLLLYTYFNVNEEMSYSDDSLAFLGYYALKAKYNVRKDKYAKSMIDLVTNEQFQCVRKCEFAEDEPVELSVKTPYQIVEYRYTPRREVQGAISKTGGFEYDFKTLIYHDYFLYDYVKNRLTSDKVLEVSINEELSYTGVYLYKFTSSSSMNGMTIWMEDIETDEPWKLLDESMEIDLKPFLDRFIVGLSYRPIFAIVQDHHVILVDGTPITVLEGKRPVINEETNKLEGEMNPMVWPTINNNTVCLHALDYIGGIELVRLVRLSSKKDNVIDLAEEECKDEGISYTWTPSMSLEKNTSYILYYKVLTTTGTKQSRASYIRMEDEIYR